MVPCASTLGNHIPHTLASPHHRSAFTIPQGGFNGISKSALPASVSATNLRRADQRPSRFLSSAHQQQVWYPQSSTVVREDSLISACRLRRLSHVPSCLTSAIPFILDNLIQSPDRSKMTGHIRSLSPHQCTLNLLIAPRGPTKAVEDNFPAARSSTLIRSSISF